MTTNALTVTPAATVLRTVRLPVVTYTDKSGAPTCATDFGEGKVCVFYATQQFGCHETCWWAGKTSNERRWPALRRRDDGKGSLIPVSECPLWLGVER